MAAKRKKEIKTLAIWIMELETAMINRYWGLSTAVNWEYSRMGGGILWESPESHWRVHCMKVGETACEFADWTSGWFPPNRVPGTRGCTFTGISCPGKIYASDSGRHRSMFFHCCGTKHQLIFLSRILWWVWTSDQDFWSDLWCLELEYRVC